MFTDWKNPWVLNTRDEKVVNQNHIIVGFQYSEDKEKLLQASKGGSGKKHK